ncbi:type I restriction enzyme S subunit [Plasticicumulans lactativorans]|uniref:Type I restriction enzyme S subunit n=1 Tax=Plasticicumulans lactativorans TaxID=1133106 RepID=A0A4V2SDA9_9GAMM|nr:restriction endonuclease subunit S [Plasticicumulans lactativorans]TCO82663.1 type I restriction enzyme S subunit [Plasticicumulans lactativorans]
MSLPRYGEYRDSGVEWLGEVPEHWEIKRLRTVAELNPSKSEIAELDRSTEVSFLPMEAIGDDGSLNLDRMRPIHEVEAGYTYFRNGDVALAKITPCFENGKGGLMRGLQGGIGFGTTELIVARPRPSETSGEYLNWIFRSPAFRKQGEASMYGAGGQKRVPDDFVRNIAWAFPSPMEQTAIAAFLDRETAKIHALIAEQEKLIALLAEKRQATISHAVTRGLDPDAPMKDSGVAWLGEVPAHWEITRLKHAASLIVDCPHETPVYDEDGTYRVIRTANVTEGRLWIEEMYSVGEQDYLNRIRRQVLAKDDIVYGREGERWGYAAQVPSVDMFCLGQRMMQFRAADSMHARYLMWQLNSLSTYRQGQMDTVGATSPHVNVRTIRNYVLANPPLGEQLEISAFLDAETSLLDALDVEAAHAVVLLKERRSALIAAAVTGQIDVRGAAQGGHA